MDKKGEKMKTLIKITLIALLFSVGGLLFAQKTTTATKQQEKTLLQPFSLFSWNVKIPLPNDGKYHWKFRKDAAIEYVKNQKADLILLNELDKSQLDEIAGALDNYKLVAGEQKFKVRGGMAPIFFNPEKFNLVEQDFSWVSTMSKEPTLAFRSIDPMMCNRVKLQDRQTRQMFFVYNFCMDRNAMQKTQPEIIDFLVRMFNDRKPDVLPVIWGGDFKVDEQNEIFRTLFTVRTDLAISPQYLAMSEAFLTPTAEKNPKIQHDFTGVAKGERTQLLVFSKGWTVLGAKVIKGMVNGMYPSDQYGLSATFTFKKMVDVPVTPPSKSKETGKATSAKSTQTVPAMLVLPSKKTVPVIEDEVEEEEVSEEDNW